MESIEKTPDELWVTTRIAHLQMLQKQIERMSIASGQIKVANTGIVTAIMSLAVSLGNPLVAVTALPIILLLSSLDAYYLSLERGFRHIFDELRVAPLVGLADFQMTVETKQSFWRAFLSPSVWPFHLRLLAIACAAFSFVVPFSTI